MPPYVPNNKPGGSNPPDSGRPPALRVMLVVASQARRRHLHEWIERIAPHSSIETSENVLDAMLRSARKPTDLLVLDLAIGGAAAPALIRHLARISPSAAVLLFDAINQPVSGHAYDVWPWSEAEAVLQRWLDARRPRGAV